MTAIATTRPDTTLANAATSGGSSRSAETAATGGSLIDRFLAPSAAASAPRTPVEQGEAARANDLAGAAAGAAAGMGVGAALGRAVAPHHPIHVGSTVTNRPNGTTLTTVHINVDANFRVDGGALRPGETAAGRARTIEQSIERDFSKTYRDASGNETRYVTDVRMTVGRPADARREQFVLVAAGDSRLGGGPGTLGRAPGFENGRTAYIADHAGDRTAPHEFGHLAGLRHTAQMPACTPAPGVSVNNLMSQTGCSATSEQIERSQLRSIFNQPQFR